MASPVWHPFTQHGLEPEMLSIARTEGAYLYRADGDPILDAISSWWVNTHGHRHPSIMQAITDTAQKLDQLIFAGFTHEPAEQLANALLDLAPKGLSHVFYSDSGSVCVEVALKMALGYFRNRGEARDRIVVMEHSYHGDTIGTMSIGARGVFNTAYEPLLFDVRRIDYPQEGREYTTLEQFETYARHGDCAALIVEPLVLGSGGMLFYTPETLRNLREIAEKYGVLFIADEVMTGWGRTGTLFACHQAGITPDILCTSKGLTGGTLPLAATLATAEIYDAHYAPDKAKMFFHSSSYTANPLACAAGFANTEIWRTEPVMQRIADLSHWQHEAIQLRKNNPLYSNVRNIGTIGALDLKVKDEGYLADISNRFRAFCLERNVLLRPLGNVVYVLPPYCITREELVNVYSVIDEAAEVLV